MGQQKKDYAHEIGFGKYVSVKEGWKAGENIPGELRQDPLESETGGEGFDRKNPLDELFAGYTVVFRRDEP